MIMQVLPHDRGDTNWLKCRTIKVFESRDYTDVRPAFDVKFSRVSMRGGDGVD